MEVLGVFLRGGGGGGTGYIGPMLVTLLGMRFGGGGGLVKASGEVGGVEPPPPGPVEGPVKPPSVEMEAAPLGWPDSVRSPEKQTAFSSWSWIWAMRGSSSELSWSLPLPRMIHISYLRLRVSSK